MHAFLRLYTVPNEAIQTHKNTSRSGSGWNSWRWSRSLFGQTRHYKSQHDNLPPLVTFYNNTGGHIEFKKNLDKTDQDYIRYNIYIVDNGISTKQQERLAIIQDKPQLIILFEIKKNDLQAKYKGFSTVSVRSQTGLLWYKNPMFYSESEYPLPQNPDVIIANVSFLDLC